MRILGVDPGVARTGYAVIETQQGKDSLSPLRFGCIETSKDEPFFNRLKIIYAKISDIIEKYSPDVLGIEELFFCKNAKTALQVGQARGAIIVAGVNADLEIASYTPLEVKLAIVGYGKASKQQVQFMVKKLLHLEETPKPDDVADALAIAMCYINRSVPRGRSDRIHRRKVIG